jgi:hypothetical protein
MSWIWNHMSGRQYRQPMYADVYTYHTLGSRRSTFVQTDRATEGNVPATSFPAYGRRQDAGATALQACEQRSSALMCPNNADARELYMPPVPEDADRAGCKAAGFPVAPTSTKAREPNPGSGSAATLASCPVTERVG